jgi:protein TonB
MVEIQKDGHVGDIHIKRKSKYKVLNKAIKEIVLAGAPYEPFTKEMAAEGDILQIVRTWTFTNRSLETSSAPTKLGG